MQLNDSVTKIPLIGPKYATALENIGIRVVKDMLYHAPRRYLDTSNIKKIAELSKLEEQTIRAKLTSLQNIRLKGRKTLQRGTISDGEDEIEVVWFFQPFLTRSLNVGDELLFFGKLNPKQTRPQLMSPDFEKISAEAEQVHLGRIAPIYPLTSGITQKWLRSRMFYLIENIDEITDIAETLSAEIRNKYRLIDLDQALTNIHFPQTEQAQQLANRRLAFEELLHLQHQLLKKSKQRSKHTAKTINVSANKYEKFKNKLEFELTRSQEKAVAEIYHDISKTVPMQRLLQGDVGSGKTVVAALAALPFIETDTQVVLLAPTSVLAKQHYTSLKEYLPKANIELITGDTNKLSKDISKIDILIGTHAILHRKSELINNLGLLIVDEQHRFGVSQRRELVNLKSTDYYPHVLQLTATPIPRSLVLTLLGDYQVSTIERHVRHENIATHVVPEAKRQDSQQWIKEKVASGGQVFWILPLIEDSEDEQLKALKAEYPKLEKVFSNEKLDLLHGKLKNKDKDAIMERFAAGKTDILVSTTVIEVGVNIPNANIIVIENAERFGLAQLHQLRGRVGRMGQPAWCLLYTATDNETTLERLNYFAKETNGIKIAEYDLERRGPGEVYGTMQSGIPPLKFARFSNLEMLKQAREAANLLFKA